MARMLILSFYYPPDLSAGSFRCKALIDAISLQRDESLEVDVVTTLPNRYKELTVAAASQEQNGWLTIHRIALPSHKSGMLDQARAFLSFAARAISLVRNREYDAVFATSSRLMTAVLGALIARQRKSRLYLDIRDLFVDTIGDILANSVLRQLIPFFQWLEKHTFLQAEAISVVSAPFESHVRSIAKTKKIWLFTNGIDTEFLNRGYAKSDSRPSSLSTILYAGNIGEGQGLEHIVPRAASMLAGKSNFKIVGSGGRLAQLKAVSTGLGNVEILPPVDRLALMTQYQEADILLLHLNDHAAFRKVLPSKLFEYSATGKPILAGVSGYAAEFLARNVQGVFLFSPLDMDGLVAAYARAQDGPQHYDRSEFCEKFARNKIMNDMAETLLSEISTIKGR